MHVIVLGAAGTYPGPGRPCSGFLLRHRTTSVLIDCGPGVFGPLAERMRPEDLDGLVISHIHPDHCTDVMALHHYLTYGPPQDAAIPTMAPPGVKELMGAFARADDAEHPFFHVLAWDVVEAGSDRRCGDVTLRFGLSDHPVPTLCVRAEADGRALAYSSDTGAGGDAFTLAEDADLFICEATWQEGEVWTDGLHLSAAVAGEKAAAAGAKRLMLTHIRPELAPERSLGEAAATFGGEVLVALPGLEVKV